MDLNVRSARLADSLFVSAILAEAFPALYTWTFGRLNTDEITALLSLLYQTGALSLDTTRLAERDGHIVGVALLHPDGSIGKGTIRTYWRTVTHHLGLRRGVRAFLGGLFANIAISARIPSEPDLLYIEALAVDTRFRSLGIGSCLLADAMDQARSLGRSRLALHVLQRNTDARRLYERFGFQLGHKEPHMPPPGSRRQQWISLLMFLTLPPLN